jgi:hypothetical protein
VSGAATLQRSDQIYDIRYRIPTVIPEAGVAQKITVALEDDLDGGPADETMHFGLDGSEYEIDLSKKNANSLRKTLAPFIEHGRRVASRGQARRGGRVANRQRSGDIRAWAKEHGISVSDRGRIPANVVEQYEAAGGRG